MAHPDRSPHRLAGHREDVRQEFVEDLLESRVLALPAFLRELPATLKIGVVELVLGWFVRGGRLEGLGPQLVEGRADRLVRHGLVFGFEGVRRVDERLEASDLAVVRVDETVQELHGR